MTTNKLNCFEIVQSQILAATERLNLGHAVFEVLKEPMNMLTVSVPVEMDNGVIR